MAILECRDLSKRFGSVQALDTVNLKIEPGRVIGLLGPNGSGKTTLLKLANGLLTPTGGEILIGGAAPGSMTHAAVSYLPDKPYLAEWMKVRQLLDFFSDFYADFDRDKATEMLLRLNIDENMRIKEMSKGTRERKRKRGIYYETAQNRQHRNLYCHHHYSGLCPLHGVS